MTVEQKITLTNLVTNTSLTMGQTSTQNYILSDVNWGTIESERQTSAHPAQIGESVLSATLGTRDVLIKGYLVNETGMGLSALKRAVAAMVNPLQPMRITYASPVVAVGTVYLDFYPLHTVSFGSDDKENNDAFCYFEIEGRAYDPLFYSTTMRSQNVSTSAASIQAAGDVKVGFTFTLTASGSVSNPAIRNNYTGQLLKFNYTLANGQKFLGSTVPGDRYVRRQYTSGGTTTQENAMRYLDLDSKWLEINPLNASANSFKVEATSGGANLTGVIQYRPAWLEVQAIE